MVHTALSKTVAPLVDFVLISTPPVLPAGFVPVIQPLADNPSSDPCIPGTCTPATP